MSVREEDRQKNSCPSRGLGIAAAAIGVGVGAALYYFFNKRQENPNSEGSSSEWNCERQQTFSKSESEDSYTTISEHDTSDTSINSSVDSDTYPAQDDSVITIESSSEEESCSQSESESEPDFSSSDSAFTVVSNDLWDISERSSPHRSSDSEETEWDITSSSHGVPEESLISPMLQLMGRIGNLISPRKRTTKEEQMAIIRQQGFRERSWTLEECSICFDVMLRNQEVTSLPCAHNFHTECIMPWLQEKQTCPNCRKVAE